MSATAVVAEILVVGLQAEFWLVLLILALQDGASVSAGLDRLKEFKEWATLATTCVLALAYALGVIVDRLSDTVFTWQDRGRILSESQGVMRLTVMKKSEGMAKFLDYQRSRVRVARGTILNVALFIVSAVLYSMIKQGGAHIGWIIGIGIVVLAVTLYAAHRINDAFFKRLEDAYKIAITP